MAQLRQSPQTAPETRQKLQAAEAAPARGLARLFEQKRDEAMAHQDT